MKINRLKFDEIVDYIPIVSAINNAIDGIQKRVFKDVSKPSDYQRHILDKGWKKCLLFSIPFAKVIYKIWERVKTHDAPAEPRSRADAEEEVASRTDESASSVNETPDPVKSSSRVENVEESAEPILPEIDKMAVVERINRDRLSMIDICTEFNLAVQDLIGWFGPEACQRIEYLKGIHSGRNDCLNDFVNACPNVKHYISGALFGNGLDCIKKWEQLETLVLRDTTKMRSDSLKILEFLPNLTTLDLDGADNLEGNLQELRHCPRLKVLILNNCIKLDPESLAILEHLNELEVLHLDHCNHFNSESLGRFIQFCPNLRSLHFNDCDQFDSETLFDIKVLKNLESLQFNNCKQLADDSLEVISDLPNLKDLHIDKCTQLLQDSLANLERCPNLESLHVEGCNQYRGKVLDVLKHCSKLKSLNIDGLNGLDPDALDVLQNCKELESLQFSNGQFREDALNVLVHCPRLQVLLIWGVRTLSANALQVFKYSDFPLLKSLKIGFMNQLAEDALDVLKNCPNLQELEIFACPQLKPDTLRVLEHCPGLKRLVVRKCPQLSPNSLFALNNCRELEYLEIDIPVNQQAQIELKRHWKSACVVDWKLVS